MRESERKRLVELLQEASQKTGEHIRDITKKVLLEKGSFSSKEDIDRRNIYEMEADHLLDNGIVVPPFPIGERVFVVITNMPFIPDDVYECKIKAWMRYADKLSPLVEIVEAGLFKGFAVSVNDTDLFTSMAAAQTILEVKKTEKMLKGEGK